jgi:hypothetical protein
MTYSLKLSRSCVQAQTSHFLLCQQRRWITVVTVLIADLLQTTNNTCQEMDLRYKFELEGKINELSSRRRTLERQCELRASTMHELNSVRQESAKRLCEAIEAQNQQASARNQALREQMYAAPPRTTVLTSSGQISKSVQGLKAAKEQYLKHVESTMPIWHRHQTIKLEERVRAIQLEKALSEQRKQQLRTDLQREIEVKQQLERHRQELLHSVSEEQRLVLESQATAILLEEQSKAATAQILSELELTSARMKEAVYATANELRERANAANDEAVLARRRQSVLLQPYVGPSDHAFVTGTRPPDMQFRTASEEAGRDYRHVHSAEGYHPPSGGVRSAVAVAAPDRPAVNDDFGPVLPSAPVPLQQSGSPHVSWHQDARPRSNTNQSTEFDENRGCRQSPKGRESRKQSFSYDNSAVPVYAQQHSQQASAAQYQPPPHTSSSGGGRSAHSQLFDAVSESQSSYHQRAEQQYAHPASPTSHHTDPASSTAVSAPSLYIQTSASEIASPVDAQATGTTTSSAAALEESNWHNPFPRSGGSSAPTSPSLVPRVSSPRGSVADAGPSPTRQASRSEFSFASDRDRESSVGGNVTDEASRLNASTSEVSAGGGSSKGIDMAALVDGLNVSQCGVLLQLLGQAIERRVTQVSASVSVTAVYDTQTRHRAAHIIDAFVHGDGAEDAGLQAVLNNAADSTLGNAVLALVEGKSSVLIPRYVTRCYNMCFCFGPLHWHRPLSLCGRAPSIFEMS